MMIKFVVWSCCGPEETVASSIEKARSNVAWRLRCRGIYIPAGEPRTWSVVVKN